MFRSGIQTALDDQLVLLLVLHISVEPYRCRYVVGASVQVAVKVLGETLEELPFG